jgi:Family of unknown function (DUF6932)
MVYDGPRSDVFSRGRDGSLAGRSGIVSGAQTIPSFRPDGYLPEGLYRATEAEITFRFGSASQRRRRLILRLRRWVELARYVGATRLLIDGSFVTGKSDPGDIDAVVLLPADFEHQIERGIAPAIELEEMLLTRRPEEIFAAEDDMDWNYWIAFFSRTREADGRRKGLVEVEL